MISSLSTDAINGRFSLFLPLAIDRSIYCLNSRRPSRSLYGQGVAVARRSPLIGMGASPSNVRQRDFVAEIGRCAMQERYDSMTRQRDILHRSWSKSAPSIAKGSVQTIHIQGCVRSTKDRGREVAPPWLQSAALRKGEKKLLFRTALSWLEARPGPLPSPTDNRKYEACFVSYPSPVLAAFGAA